jgi:Dimethlysulfonioproprionate lyase
MTEAALLGVPLGAAGSGRERYGVAMALYAQGHMSPAVLEAYRVAAAHDKLHPGATLADRELSHSEGVLNMAEGFVRQLVAEVDAYLGGLVGPGVADVRQGLARFADGPVTTVPPQPNAVRDTYLPEALAALSRTHPTLAAAIDRAAGHLTWITYDGYDPTLIGSDFIHGHAYASIIGEAAAIPARDYDLGLFVIAPHVLYRDHCHAAPELYMPLTGPHGWRFGPDRPLILKPAHDPVWNPPFQTHLTKVGPVPFLCLFGWTKDVQPLAKVVPAQDWPELEALRLEP